jgi:8-oxo-dGTP pyrophosphatase MutT (NUDIX family)
VPNVHAHRLTSRVLLFDHDDRVLLFLTASPDSSRRARWITPGGGVDPGETHLEAALRELEEETGLRLDELTGPVWSHDFAVEWDSADHDTGHAVLHRGRRRLRAVGCAVDRRRARRRHRAPLVDPGRAARRAAAVRAARADRPHPPAIAVVSGVT